MRVSSDRRDINIRINGTKIEQVKSFNYFGHTMTDDGRCETEIKYRIVQAKEAFDNRKEILTKGLKKSTKIKIVKTLVWTTLLYGKVDAKVGGYFEIERKGWKDKLHWQTYK